MQGRGELGLLWWQGGWGRVWQYLHFINSPVRFGKFEFTVVSMLQGVVVLVAAFIVSRFLRAVISNRLTARAHLDPGLQFTLLRLTHYALLTAGILFAFNLAFGADFTSLAVVFTALSVGIGFGLQYIAGDIASGFILLFERPVRIGDFVTVASTGNQTIEGRVHSINLRTTIVITNDRIAVIVPNSKLVNERLTNWTHTDRRSRIAIPIGVASDADVELVTQTLLRAAEGVEYVLTEPKPSVQFVAFGDYTLDFRLLVCTDRPRRHAQIKSDINYRIWQLFKEAGIDIPDPRRNLTLHGGALDVRVRNADVMEAEGADEDEEKERPSQFTH